MTGYYPQKDKVVLRFTQYGDADFYIKPLAVLEEAQHALEAVLSDLPSSELHNYHDAVNAAEADVEALFTEEMTIEQAERQHRRLGAAILNAKAFRGDFARAWSGDDN